MNLLQISFVQWDSVFTLEKLQNNEWSEETFKKLGKERKNPRTVLLIYMLSAGTEQLVQGLCDITVTCGEQHV